MKIENYTQETLSENTYQPISLSPPPLVQNVEKQGKLKILHKNTTKKIACGGLQNSENKEENSRMG